MSKSKDFVQKLNDKFNPKYEFGIKKGFKYDKIVRVIGGKKANTFAYMKKKDGSLHKLDPMTQEPHPEAVYAHDEIMGNMDKVDPYGMFVNERKK